MSPVLRSFTSPVVVLFGLLSSAGDSAAQSVEFRIDSRVMEVGEAVDAAIVFTNTGQPDPPQLPSLNGLNLVLTSATPNSNQSIRMINGRTTQTVTYTYGVRVVAVKAGTYRIPAMTLSAGGSSYVTSAVEVTVKKAEVGPSAKGDRMIFAEIEVDRRRVYVTETLRATLTIGIRKVVIGGRAYELDNLLNTVIDGRASELSVFREGRYSVSEQTLTETSGRRNAYEIYRVPVEVRAEQIGEIDVGPVFLAARYPTSLRRGFFGAVEVGESRRETARAEGIKVTVLGPPEIGRPADFSGAIGRYSMSVTAKPDRVEQGQPVTLSVAIRGAPLEGIAGPDLLNNPELSSRFEFSREELAGDVEQGAKVFRRAVFPKQAGEQTIPPLSWSYFDPQDERYVTLTSDPVPITVDPGRDSASIYAGADLTERLAPTSLTALRGGILPNYVDPTVLLASQATLVTTPIVVAMIGAPASWFVITWIAVHQRRLRTDVAWARRRRAHKSASARLSQAAKSAAPASVAGACADAIALFLADRFDLPPGPVTPSDARDVLQQHGVPDEVGGQVAGFLERCDAVRFAGGDLDGMSTAEACALARRWIDQIERLAR